MESNFWGVIKNHEEESFQIIGPFSKMFLAEKIDEIVCKLQGLGFPVNGEFPAKSNKHDIIEGYKHINYKENPKLISSIKQQLRILKSKSNQADLIEIILSALESVE